jgi:hypothetical protein
LLLLLLLNKLNLLKGPDLAELVGRVPLADVTTRV